MTSSERRAARTLDDVQRRAYTWAEGQARVAIEREIMVSHGIVQVVVRCERCKAEQRQHDGGCRKCGHLFGTYA